MLYGVDIHSQYQQGISIARLKAEGYTFVVDKASEGTYIPSNSNMSPAQFKAQMLAWVAETRALGMVPGLYHWLKAGNAAAQARFFYRQVVDAGGPAGMIIQLDDEDNASYADAQIWAAEWNQLSGGHPFLLYTGAWWWGPRGWDGNAVTPYLWHSHYLSADTDTISDDPATFAARIPASWWTPGYGGWPGATFLQFTSRGDAGSLGNDVDLNVFRGTLADLMALTGGVDMSEADILQKISDVALFGGTSMGRKVAFKSDDGFTGTLNGLAPKLDYALDSLDGLTGKVDALVGVIEQLAAVITAGGGSVDTQAILAGVDERLAAVRAGIEADTRDAIADAEEGGAAAVRADAN
jgi:Glycosyl hydrolases family 25